jgi:LysR family transcriptional regulator, cys regulon transcriptional activator
MNLRQLRFLAQVADSGYNITSAAQALHTTQPGVSKQLLALERELGVDILVRRGNRIIGYTAPGKAILTVARRMLNDARTIRTISDEFGTQDSGRLVVATTHTHARYVLSDVVQAFTQRYPKVQLVLRQENATRVAELVATGEADLGVSAVPDEPPPDVIMLPCYSLPRTLIAPSRHPVLKMHPLTIEGIARYPIIALDPSFAGGRRMLRTFAAAGCKPNVVMSATDTEVIKWYVRRGLGIAILPAIAFDPLRDRGLRAIDVSSLFEANIACLMLRRNHYLLRHLVDFIHFLAPHWTREALDRALETGRVPDHPVASYPQRR